MLAAAMFVSAFQVFAIAVLASALIDDLGLSRADIGVVGSVNTLVGAITAPFSGRLTDRLGPGRSVVAVFSIGAIGIAAMAWAPSLAWLVVASLVSGLAQGLGNPATNAYIAANVEPGRRGRITGVKQSGVTLGVFASGAALPSMSAAWGWRTATWACAVTFATAAVVAAVVLTRAQARRSRTAAAAERPRPAAPSDLPSFVWPLALYALLMGSAGGAIGRFLPLFAEEAANTSTQAAGAIVAAAGLLGILARVIAGRQAERHDNADLLLTVFAAVGAVFCLLLVFVTPDRQWLLFATPPLNAVGIAAWNAVAMLAVITRAPPGGAGRSSGIVMLGFLGGMTVSGPTAGWAVDRLDDYRPVWIAAALCAGAATALAARTRRRAARSA